MADLFRQSDLVICSASTVCIEALFCNTKVAAGWFVDNQMDFYNLVTAKGWGNRFGQCGAPLYRIWMLLMHQRFLAHL